MNNNHLDRLSVENPPSQEADYAIVSSNYPKTEKDFARFNACNTVFARAQWDTRIRTKKAISYFKSMIGGTPSIRNTDGYTQKDFALRNAGWTIANLTIERNLSKNRHDGFLDNIEEYKPIANEMVIQDKNINTKELKKIAKLFGASLLGIAPLDLRWHYTHRFDAVNCKEKAGISLDAMKHCIIFAVEMPYSIVKTYPSAYAGFAPGFSYSKETFIVQGVAQYIRNLGYNASASLNDTANSIPYAIQAGLGEYARNGLVINKKYGPRIRFGMIFTDLDLENDGPKSFGVENFCKSCNLCAESCPAKAITFGMPDTATYNQSNIKGIKKWSVDGEKCFKIWANQGTECGICVRVCPYNLDNKILSHRIFRFVLINNPIHKLTLYIFKILKFGERMKPSFSWKL